MSNITRKLKLLVRNLQPELFQAGSDGAKPMMQLWASGKDHCAPTPGVTNTGPNPQPSSVTNPIIPTGYQPGPKQSIHDFCRFYSLSDGIFDKFDQNAFTGTHAFRRLNSSDLRAMNFKPGEIIDLKDAIEEWAIKIS